MAPKVGPKAEIIFDFDGAKVVVHNIRGDRVMNVNIRDISKSNPIDLSSLPSGNYLITAKLESEEQQKTLHAKITLVK